MGHLIVMVGLGEASAGLVLALGFLTVMWLLTAACRASRDVSHPAGRTY